ncbi:uncharacterized protein LOC128920483 isoform X2 [Zeugodacus cucurbitae]|uniref:uncharacterized protein LOC128920483 isoform X2 n=1 Tax=Zeugodacus cucurbitae TaxID=28588 RepID=UPI0023D9077C|nr:uncharacterized protein LOC128920483 isoform X2 [Zeugodacus cucurbitae]
MKSIKRMSFNAEAKDRKECNCQMFQKRMEEMFDDMKETMLQDNKLLRDQLRICMEAVVDMKVVVNKWNRHIAEETVLTAKFPLSSVEEVECLNAEINNDNRECYVKTMKSLFRPAGVVKNLKEILTDAVVQEYNIDGIHGKKSLRSLENFYSTLIESIPVSDDFEPAEKQLRKAIQLQKNRINKAKSVHKNKNKSEHDMNIDI